ncbi:chemotaxis protein CheD [bacterium]|nr:chemotaxis protein CheD [bacterium]
MERFIKMNEIVVAKSPYLIRTVVGSCIALCIWDGCCRIGGMGHIMLPESNGDSEAPPGKYADIAVKKLVSIMVDEGSLLKRMQATCIGGASMFQNHQNAFESIGSKNYRTVKEELKNFGIPIVTEAVGGILGRRVEMNCANGAITISMLLKPG